MCLHRLHNKAHHYAIAAIVRELITDAFILRTLRKYFVNKLNAQKLVVAVLIYVLELKEIIVLPFEIIVLLFIGLKDYMLRITMGL